MMEKVSETIKVSKEAKEKLLKVAADIQSREGRRVDLDEAIKYLLRSGRRRPKLLADLFGIVPGLTTKELFEERMRDERAAKRKYGL